MVTMKFTGRLATVIPRHFHPIFAKGTFLKLPVAQVMDCYKYGGLPQRRPRLWIVGLNKYAVKSTLAFAVRVVLIGSGWLDDLTEENSSGQNR